MDLAISFFGYKLHVPIEQKFRLIQKCRTTNAAASDCVRSSEGLLDTTNTASAVWANMAGRSKANEDFMDSRALSQKSKGKSRTSHRCSDMYKNRMLESQ